MKSIGTIVLCGLPTFAAAQSLFISQPNTEYDAHYGSARWGETTSSIDARFASVTLGDELDDLDELLGYDRLWIDQRLDTPLSGVEVSNLLDFAATGRRVVIIGENPDWTNWNESFLNALGGSAAGRYNGITHALASHDLTAGVSTVTVLVGSVAGGGQQLFEENFATLWGGQTNVLTILDSDLWEDRFLDAFDNRRFTQNVINWLAVPSPSACAPLGLSGLIIHRRRR